MNFQQLVTVAPWTIILQICAISVTGFTVTRDW